MVCDQVGAFYPKWLCGAGCRCSPERIPAWPIFTRVQAEKEALAALCGGALDIAGASFIVGRICRF